MGTILFLLALSAGAWVIGQVLSYPAVRITKAPTRKERPDVWRTPEPSEWNSGRELRIVHSKIRAGYTRNR